MILTIWKAAKVIIMNNNTVVEIKLNDNGKYILIIDGVVIGYDYKTSSKACQRAYRYLKGQNK